MSDNEQNTNTNTNIKSQIKEKIEMDFCDQMIDDTKPTMTTPYTIDYINEFVEEIITEFDMDFDEYDDREIDKSLAVQPYDNLVEMTFYNGEYSDDFVLAFIDEFIRLLKINPLNNECLEEMYLFVEDDLDERAQPVSTYEVIVDRDPRKIITLYLYLYATSLH
tara:strand:+ start:586 stop:1077 length:492 start_codon:yes stop_codon:yes gene_type:complete